MECAGAVPGHLLYSLPLAWNVLVLYQVTCSIIYVQHGVCWYCTGSLALKSTSSMECADTVPGHLLQSTSSMGCVHTVPGHLLYSLPLAWSVLVLDTRSPVAQSTHINNRNSHETIRRWLFMEKTKCYSKDSRHKNPHPARK